MATRLSTPFLRKEPESPPFHQIWIWQDRYITLIEKPEGFIFAVQKVGADRVDSLHGLAFDRSRTDMIARLNRVNVVLNAGGKPQLMPLTFSQRWTVNIQTQPASNLEVSLARQEGEIIFCLMDKERKIKSWMPISEKMVNATAFLSAIPMRKEEAKSYLESHRVSIQADGYGQVKSLFFYPFIGEGLVKKTWLWKGYQIDLIEEPNLLKLEASHETGRVVTQGVISSNPAEFRSKISQIFSNNWLVTFNEEGSFFYRKWSLHPKWKHLSQKIDLIEYGGQLAWHKENRVINTVSVKEIDPRDSSIIEFLNQIPNEKGACTDFFMNYEISVESDNYYRIKDVSITPAYAPSELDSTVLVNKEYAAVTFICAKYSSDIDPFRNGHAMLAVELFEKGALSTKCLHLTKKPKISMFPNRPSNYAEIEIMRGLAHWKDKGPTLKIPSHRVRSLIDHLETKSCESPVPFNMTGNGFFSSWNWRIAFGLPARKKVSPQEEEPDFNLEKLFFPPERKPWETNEGGYTQEYNCLTYLLSVVPKFLGLEFPAAEGLFSEPSKYVEKLRLNPHLIQVSEKPAPYGDRVLQAILGADYFNKAS